MTTTSPTTARPGIRVRRSAALLAVLAAVGAAGLSGPDGAAAAPPDSSFDAVAASLDGVDKTSNDVAPGAASSTAGEQSSSGMHRTVHEREHPALAGYNDDLDDAERIRRRTSRPNGVDLHIAGTLADVAAPAAPIGPFAEDDGAIQLANPSGLSGNIRAVRASATIGDGPHGTAGDGSGDFDFYSIADATAGQTLTVDIDAASTGSALDAVVAVIAPSGAILAFNDDSPELDSFLQFELPADGDYLVAVAAFGSLPTNPFDSGSGRGATSEGHYELTMSFAFAEDIDVYSVKLHRGDVLAASVTGAGRILQVFSPDGDLVMGAGRDLSAFYPDASPLRVGGNATVDHVAAVTGRHYVMVSRGVGPYEVDVRLRRPGFESGGHKKRQILFLDFDGAFVDPSTFGTESGTLSPLEHFLGGWNLDSSDEDALINSILATFTENIEADPSDRGGNRRFAVDIRNSRDDGDRGEHRTSRASSSVAPVMNSTSTRWGWRSRWTQATSPARRLAWSSSIRRVHRQARVCGRSTTSPRRTPT